MSTPFYLKEDLDQNAVKEKWDRVRIICTQPFRKDAQFGLALFCLHTTDEVNMFGRVLRSLITLELYLKFHNYYQNVSDYPIIIVNYCNKENNCSQKYFCLAHIIGFKCKLLSGSKIVIVCLPISSFLMETEKSNG